MTDTALPPPDISSSGTGIEPARREIRYEHSLNLGPILDRFGVSLLVSTYQAGKLGVIGRDGDQAHLFISQLRAFHGGRGGRRPDRGRIDGPGLVFAERAQDRRPDRAGGAPRRVFPDAVVARDGRDPGPRDGVGAVTSSGWSTRRFPACARSTTSTASFRAGGRRLSRRWRPRIDVI